jgi:hypothetical protein
MAAAGILAGDELASSVGSSASRRGGGGGGFWARQARRARGSPFIGARGTGEPWARTPMQRRRPAMAPLASGRWATRGPAAGPGQTGSGVRARPNPVG